MKHYYFICIDKQGNQTLFKSVCNEAQAESVAKAQIPFYAVVDFHAMEDWQDEECFAWFILHAYGIGDLKEFNDLGGK